MSDTYIHGLMVCEGMRMYMSDTYMVLWSVKGVRVCI